MTKESRPKGYWKSLSNQELERYISDNFRGKPINAVAKGCSRAYIEANRRGIIDPLVEKSVLIRQKQRKGFYSGMTNAQIIDYVQENYAGKTFTYFSKDVSRLREIIRERGLMPAILERNILVRDFSNTPYANMNGGELIEHIKQNYTGMSVFEFSQKAGRAYQLVCQQKLLGALVERKILVRRKKENGFYSKMSDEELIRHIKDGHHEKSINAFQKSKDKGVYETARERGLISVLVERGILKRLKPDQSRGRNFSEISDGQVVDEISRTYSGKKISQFSRLDGTLYQVANKRNLINSLVEQGVLIRIKEGTRRKNIHSTDILEAILDGGKING